MLKNTITENYNYKVIKADCVVENTKKYFNVTLELLDDSGKSNGTISDSITANPGVRLREFALAQGLTTETLVSEPNCALGLTGICVASKSKDGTWLQVEKYC